MSIKMDIKLQTDLIVLFNVFLASENLNMNQGQARVKFCGQQGKERIITVQHEHNKKLHCLR